MTLHDSIETTRPCANGCLRPGTDYPADATHGKVCGRCWVKLDAPLAIAPVIAATLAAYGITANGTSDGKVDNAQESTTPFNQAAFDDLNGMYSALVYWCHVWADTLGFQPPEVAQHAWRDERGTVIGLPANPAPETATRTVHALTRWLQDRLDSILNHPGEDLAQFTEATTDLWRISTRWSPVDRPAYSAMPCVWQDCGAKIRVYPPAFPGDDRRIVCGNGHHYLDTEYEHHIHVFKQQAEEDLRSQKRTERAVRHLAKKYGIGA
jgi:hypothetical protein